MMNSAVTAKLRLGAIALGVALLGTVTIAHAHGGGGGGGGHGGGFGGGHGGGYGGHGGYGHGGYGHGGYGHGGYGHRGSRGRGYGYYGFGYYDDFGLLGYGLFLDDLPFYYSNYWWGGVPYYYANDTSYQWNAPAGQSANVPSPLSVPDKVTAQSADLNVFAYPMNGQAAAQQAADRAECQGWATSQAGNESSKREDFLRAQAACLQGRGYSVK
jgi:hypothetical protein